MVSKLFGFSSGLYFLVSNPTIKSRTLRDLIKNLIVKDFDISDDVKKVFFFTEPEILKLEQSIRETALTPINEEYETKIPEKIKSEFLKFVFLAQNEAGADQVWVRDYETKTFYSFGKLSPEIIANSARTIYNYPSIKREAGCEYMRYSHHKKASKGTPKGIMGWFVDLFKEYLDSLVSRKIVPFVWLENETDTPLDGFISPTIFSKEKLEEALEKNEPMKYWPQILERLSDKETFLAWCWLLFSDPKVSTRQILWIRGNGHDGKTTLSRVISKYLGLANICAWDLEPNSKNQFTTSKFRGKRLTTNSESHITRILDDKIVFRITGGDFVDIEGKGKDSYSEEISTFMLFNANKAPQINTYDPSHVSRLLYLEIEARKEEVKTATGRNFIADSNFEENLLSEKYQFLALCKKTYYTMKFLDARGFDSSKTIEPLEILGRLNLDTNKENRDKFFSVEYKNTRIPLTPKTHRLIMTHCCDSIYSFFSNFFLKDNFEITKKFTDRIPKHYLQKTYREYSREYGEEGPINFKKLLDYLLLNGCQLGELGAEIIGIRVKTNEEIPETALDIPS